MDHIFAEDDGWCLVDFEDPLMVRTTASDVFVRIEDGKGQPMILKVAKCKVAEGRLIEFIEWSKGILSHNKMWPDKLKVTRREKEAMLRDLRIKGLSSDDRLDMWRIIAEFRDTGEVKTFIVTDSCEICRTKTIQTIANELKAPTSDSNWTYEKCHRPILWSTSHVMFDFQTMVDKAIRLSAATGFTYIHFFHSGQEYGHSHHHKMYNPSGVVSRKLLGIEAYTCETFANLVRQILFKQDGQIRYKQVPIGTFPFSLIISRCNNRAADFARATFALQWRTRLIEAWPNATVKKTYNPKTMCKVAGRIISRYEHEYGKLVVPAYACFEREPQQEGWYDGALIPGSYRVVA
jgi:hypothetical protein